MLMDAYDSIHPNGYKRALIIIKRPKKYFPELMGRKAMNVPHVRHMIVTMLEGLHATRRSKSELMFQTKIALYKIATSSLMSVQTTQGIHVCLPFYRESSTALSAKQ